MAFPEYAGFDGLALADLVRRKEVTSLELVDAAIERIEKLDPELNAVVHQDFERARETAKGPLPDGPFQGVPFLIKDLGQQVAGMPRTSGSRFLKDWVDHEDTELVRRYRAAGVVILGKTNTPEFGITGTSESRLLGPCRTPHDPTRISGGSSGGAAAATAAGMVPLAHASDGLGSIRIPAACCGLFGLKPTRDRNPSGGLESGRAVGFGVDHVVSRTVRDSAAMLDATGFPEPATPYPAPPKERPYLEEIARPPQKLRIAFSAETPSGRPIEPEVLEAFHETVKLLAELGHEMIERGLNVDYRALYKARGPVSSANAAAQLAEWTLKIGREPEPDELEPLTWAGIRLGRKLTGEAVLRGWRTFQGLRRDALRIFEEVDVFLTPIMGTLLPEIGHLSAELEPKELSRRQARVFPYTPPFNFTGQPAMSVPVAWSPAGLPIGMQIAGRYADEATLLRLAAQMEEALPWVERRPAVFA